MNTITTQTHGEGLKTITFRSKSGHELSFGFIENEDQVRVFEVQKIGKNAIAKESTLPLQWLKSAVKHNANLLSSDGKFGMGTPLQATFGFSKNDLIKLQDFMSNI